MKKLAIAALALLLTGTMASCGFGPDSPKDQVIVDETPTPEPTRAPTPTPTISPQMQDTTYTSVDRSVSIKLPDATWVNRGDANGQITFESPDQGKIIILHASSQDVVIPDGTDMVRVQESGAGREEGVDYEIQNYNKSTHDNADDITYRVHYLNPAKSDGYAYAIYRYLVNAQEVYKIEADGRADSQALINSLVNSMESFTILGDSALKAASQISIKSVAEAPAAPPVRNADVTSSSFTDEQLSDRSQTRTIYDNATGKGLVIFPNSEGVWTDVEGNTYEFYNDEDVYDQNGKDFYYHGEAGDVLFMSTQQ